MSTGKLFCDTVQKDSKIKALLRSLSAKTAIDLTTAITEDRGHTQSRDTAISCLAIVIENVIFELTDIMVGNYFGLDMMMVPNFQ